MIEDYIPLIISVVPPRNGRVPRADILRYLRAVIDLGTDRVPVALLGRAAARRLQKWGIVYSLRGGGGGDVRATERVRPIIEEILKQDATIGRRRDDRKEAIACAAA